MTKSLLDLSKEFAGRRALVTGGSRGIGAAIAQRLLDAGATVDRCGGQSIALPAVEELLGCSLFASPVSVLAFSRSDSVPKITRKAKPDSEASVFRPGLAHN